MSGYREPNEPNDGFFNMMEWRALTWLLLAPVAVGGYLLVTGLSAGAYLMAGIGGLILGCAPVMFYHAWRSDLE